MIIKSKFFREENSFETLVYACIFSKDKIEKNRLTNHFILTDYMVSSKSKWSPTDQAVSIDQLEEIKYFPNVTDKTKIDFEKWLSYEVEFLMLVEKFDFMLVNKNNILWKCSFEDLDEHFAINLKKIENIYKTNINILTFVRKKIGH
jgi:hypothetical protein